MGFLFFLEHPGTFFSTPGKELGNAKKKPSFGVFLNLLRLLMKAEGKSVCDAYFEKGKSYPAVSEFVFNYELMKSEVINKGQDRMKCRRC